MKLLQITIRLTGQLLFLGWVDEQEKDKVIERYQRDYPGLLNIEVIEK